MKKHYFTLLLCTSLAGCSAPKPPQPESQIHVPINQNPIILEPQQTPVERPPLTQLIPTSKTVTVSFRYNSTVFSPSAAEKAQIQEQIQSADRIIIRGRTDGWNPTRGNQSIAHRRAIAARDYLIDLGASQSIMQINYYPAGNNIANNRNGNGRALNRRVEIEFIKNEQRIEP